MSWYKKAYSTVKILSYNDSYGILKIMKDNKTYSYRVPSPFIVNKIKSMIKNPKISDGRIMQYLKQFSDSSLKQKAVEPNPQEVTERGNTREYEDAIMQELEDKGMFSK